MIEGLNAQVHGHMVLKTQPWCFDSLFFALNGFQTAFAS